MNGPLFRCSSIGKLMGESRTKGAVLSDTAKAYVRELASQAIYGVDFEVSSKQMEKGVECESAGIELYNRVFGKNLTKNVDRRTDDYLTGESDLPDVDEVTDIKIAWSVATFPLSNEDIAATQRTLYEWQLRSYCRLWNKPRGRIAYCLVDTPERLIGFEPLPLHIVSHIPEHLRVTTWVVERDMAKEAAIIEKVKAARAYYAEVIREFDRTHRIGGVVHESAQSLQPAATAPILELTF